MTTKQVYEPTPLPALKHIARFVNDGYGSMLDPCAGNGDALSYLSGEWALSRYGIEPNSLLYHEMVRQNDPAGSLNEYASAVFARSFMVIYTFPPTDLTAERAIQWLEWIRDAAGPQGICIWRLPKRIVLNPDWIKAFDMWFEDTEFYLDPPGLQNVTPDLFNIRSKRSEKSQWIYSAASIQQMVKRIEEAVGIDVAKYSPWRYYSTSAKFAFRLRGVEWEDVVTEVYDWSWPRLWIPFAKEYVCFSDNAATWARAKKEGFDPLTQLRSPYVGYVNRDAEVWVDCFAAQDRNLYMVSMIGRKKNIQIIEHGLKASAFMQIGNSKTKLEGGGTNWQERYVSVMHKLPSGAFHCVWFHKNATGKPLTDRIPILMPHNSVVQAQMLSGVTGLPIVAEWVDEIMVGQRRIDRRSSIGLSGGFIYAFEGEIMNKLTKLAAAGNLPEPKRRQPEILRPIMPPSTGIWAQLAMQEFVNDIPLPGNIIMHSRPIELIDTEVGESLDKKVEVTEIIRKDAVRIVVFHYGHSNGFSPGDWEIYQTETAEDFDNAQEGEEEDKDES